MKIMKLRLYAIPSPKPQSKASTFGNAWLEVVEPYPYEQRKLFYGNYYQCNGYSLSYEEPEEVHPTYAHRLSTIDAERVHRGYWHANVTWIPEAWERFVTGDYWHLFEEEAKQ